jgi:hypothetical protein
MKPRSICRLRLAGKEVQRFPGPHDIVLRQASCIECEFVLPGYQDSSKQFYLLPTQKFSIATKLIPGTGGTGLKRHPRSD